MMNLDDALEFAENIVDKFVDIAPKIAAGLTALEPLVLPLANMVPGGGASVALVEGIVKNLLNAAPAIAHGVESTAPYVRAIAGLLTGGNATQEQVDALLAQLDADSSDFQKPLPPDDGTTTT